MRFVKQTDLGPVLKLIIELNFVSDSVLKTFAAIFRTDAADGLSFLGRTGVDVTNARELARVLFRTSNIAMQLGQYLSLPNDFNKAVLSEFLKLFDFSTTKSVLDGLRLFVQKVGLNGTRFVRFFFFFEKIISNT
jgi:hypothetical protein